MKSATPDWINSSLSELTDAQWESLCDGCGKCCMAKLQDSDTGKIYYTNVACKLFDENTCRCTDYNNRTSQVPECVRVSLQNPEVFSWLPNSCAYRLRYETKPLFNWHPLVNGDDGLMHDKNHSVQNKTVSPLDAGPLEFHLVNWD
ncbi:MAG: YcgN family cysteine cluster protein [Gammaproteobacteria bacterium]|nr:YcgN family cysteine cluster protein [Gammaproteobacteria bacterium]